MADAVRDATLLSSESKPSPSLSVMTEMRQSSGSTAESLLPIVSSQRERFKQKNAELEAVSYIIYDGTRLIYTCTFNMFAHLSYCKLKVNHFQNVLFVSVCTFIQGFMNYGTPSIIQ